MLKTFLERYKSLLEQEGFVETLNMKTIVRYKRMMEPVYIIITFEPIKNKNMIKIKTALSTGVTYYTNIAVDDTTGIFERLLLSYHNSENYTHAK